MRDHLIVLGGNQLHAGFQQRKDAWKIKQVIVIDWNEHPDYVGDRHIRCDIKNYEEIIKQKIDWDRVKLVYTSADIAVDTQRKLHERLGFCIPEKESIQNTQLKGNSTGCFERAGILNKYSEVLAKPEEFQRYGTGKYIFKPNCSSGSRNITILEGKNLTRAQVGQAFSLAAEGSADSRVIVEEFCEGTEYTVDMLGDSYGNVAVFGISKKYHTPYNKKNKIAVKLHYSPNDVSDGILKEIAAFGQKCYRALGLKNSFGHLEIIVCEDGRMVPVEIGARSSGYIASHLLDLINDSNYMESYARVLEGQAIKDGVVFDWNRSSMYYFYDVTPGISRCACSLMEFLPKGINSYSHNRIKLVSGREFYRIQADHERYGFEILGGRREILTIENVRDAEARFNDKFIQSWKVWEKK